MTLQMIVEGDVVGLERLKERIGVSRYGFAFNEKVTAILRDWSGTFSNSASTLCLTNQTSSI